MLLGKPCLAEEGFADKSRGMAFIFFLFLERGSSKEDTDKN
jgi:hypothetical protein